MERCRLSVYTCQVGARTPGALQARKIAALCGNNTSSTVAIAEGASLYLVQLPEQQANLTPSEGKPFRLQAGFVHLDAKLLFTFSSGQAIEFLTVPEQGEESWKLIATTAVGEAVYCDAQGVIKECRSASYRPASWAASILVGPGQEQMATAHHSAKQIRVDDLESGQCVRSFPSVFYPSSLTSLSENKNTFLTTEYNQLCLWDVRAQNPSVQRLPISSTWLYASAAKGHTVATGGKSRTIEVLDQRKWKFQDRWTNCLKFDVTSILFSEISDELLFVSGVDSELVCGRWRVSSTQDGKRASFRADSRWVGMSTLRGQDVLVGYNENGNIYHFNPATHLYPAYTGEPTFQLGLRNKSFHAKRQPNSTESPPVKKARNK